jgi:hypothetical protein
MPRTLVLALGVILWTSFALVTILHAAAGDWMGPLVAGIVVAAGVALYHLRRRTVKAS